MFISKRIFVIVLVIQTNKNIEKNNFAYISITKYPRIKLLQNIRWKIWLNYSFCLHSSDLPYCWKCKPFSKNEQYEILLARTLPFNKLFKSMLRNPSKLSWHLKCMISEESICESLIYGSQLWQGSYFVRILTFTSTFTYICKRFEDVSGHRND